MLDRPTQPRLLRALGACLAPALLGLALWGDVPVALGAPDGEAPADAVVLRGGERLACRVVEERAGFVTIELHGRTYRLERARLEGVERQGRPAVDPELVEAAVRWAREADSPHPGIRRGARAALEALTTSDTPALVAAREQLGEAPMPALDDILATLRAREQRDGENEWVARGLGAIGLDAERAPVVARIARDFIFRLARGGSESGALAELRQRLAPHLDQDDLEALVAALMAQPPPR